MLLGRQANRSILSVSLCLCVCGKGDDSRKKCPDRHFKNTQGLSFSQISKNDIVAHFGAGLKQWRNIISASISQSWKIAGLETNLIQS